MKQEVRGARSRALPLAVGLGVILLQAGCATLAPPGPATPGEIPGLEERSRREPGNGRVQLRLGAAYLAADRCPEAMAAAERGRALLPEDPAGPLIIGRCLEEAGEYEDALALYSGFIEENEGGPGVAAVEGRREIALRRQAREAARTAIENEEALGPPDPQTVGVLPFLVDGDSIYQPLRLGLANMLTTDLSLVRQFRMVERVQLSALLEELRLPSDLIDPSTAAQTGRLVGAARMVLGTVSIPSEDQTRMSSNVVVGTGEVLEPFQETGDLRDLFDLEKELAIRTAESLGYQLTEAEIQRIRQNVPADLASFLSFSRGLMAEDAGDFEAAAAHYSEALRLDPGYQEAQERLRTSVGAEVVSRTGGGEVINVTSQVAQSLGEASGAVTAAGASGFGAGNILASTLDSSIIDVASHQAERIMERVGSEGIAEVIVEEGFTPPVIKAFLLITIVIPR